MYLSDLDLKSILGELEFETKDPGHKFNPLEQIQPCSIDLRLDRTFWRQKRRSHWPYWPLNSSIDLRNAQLLEIEPRRHWEKRVLPPNQGITVNPGEMVLGRTYEKFRIPRKHAGKLEGHSSFARMGLAIHCAADFINPGYGGHMPLQLTNHGKTSITLFPYLPICQLMIVRLSSDSERVYGDRDLHSKYVNDDGGPSYWWRDKRVKKLHQALGKHSVAGEIQEQILALIGRREPEMIDRFEKFVSRLQQVQMTNADDILDSFAVAEGRAKKRATFRRHSLLWVGPAMLPLMPSMLLGGSGQTAIAISAAVAAVALLVSGWEYFLDDPPGEFLTTRELSNLRRQQTS